jgi:3-oxoacyl-[acyl-carrier protein] reductase
MTDLRGLNAIVTGSTRGLGLSIATALAGAGANVVINGRTDEACRRAADVIGNRGGTTRYVVGGIADEPTAQALVDCCRESFGPVGFVVNNAGITRDKSLLNMSVDDFDEVVAVHLRGTWLMCRAAARAIKSTGGAIVNVTSGSSLFGLVGQSNYAAAKGGINALTRALSVELSRCAIRVNALYPVALTDMTAPVVAMSGGSDSPLTEVFGDPDDVAKVVVALADPVSTSISGQIIGFDGTNMAVWSHPDRIYQITCDAPWSDIQLNAAMEHIATVPADLHPDEVGAQTRAALRRARG